MMLSVLREWIAGNPRNGEIEPAFFLRHHLEALCYYYRHDTLDEPWRSVFGSRYRGGCAVALRREQALRNLFRQLREANIRFCPIKGADLAWRSYPHPALRPHVDWDLLIHPDDCGRIASVLGRYGWRSEIAYRHPHHLPPFYRGEFMLEIHHHLPRFKRIAPEEVWRLIRADDKGIFRLPGAVNLLMLFQHAGGHCWENGMRFLLDVAFLLRLEPVAGREVEQMAARWRLRSPTVVFAAFPELFPEYGPMATAVASSVAADFRAAVLSADRFAERRHEAVMSISDRFSCSWWRERLSGLQPVRMRLKYRKAKTQPWRLPIYYGQEIVSKIQNFWRFRHGTRDSDFLAHLKRVERLQQYMKEF